MDNNNSNRNNNQHPPVQPAGGSGGDLPNMKVVKGLVFVALGVLMIFIAYKVIVQMALFTGGLALVYYGLRALDISEINKVINMVSSRCQALWNKIRS